MSYGDKPFGLSDIKVTNILGTAQADLPAAQQLQFRPIFTSERLRGDDAIKAVVSIIDGAEWSLQAGGISIDALAIMTGNGKSVGSTSPTETTTLVFDGADVMPYFKIYGKSVGDGSDDLHIKLWKCKLTALEGTLADGQFFITNCQGIAIDDDSNGVASIVQNETATTLPTT